MKLIVELVKAEFNQEGRVIQEKIGDINNIKDP